jgi:hypothetical protein
MRITDPATTPPPRTLSNSDMLVLVLELSPTFTVLTGVGGLYELTISRFEETL